MAVSRKAVPPFMMLQIMILLLLQVCDGVPGVRLRRQLMDNRDVFYTSVCEGSTMDLRCPPGLVIYIEQANFGRVDNLTCVTGPVLNTDCYSPVSKEIVSLGCDKRASCSIPTTSEHFGDPCPGTVKYLEVLFECLSALPPTTPRLSTPKPVTNSVLSLGTELPGDSTTLPDDITTQTPSTTTKVPSTTVTVTIHKPKFCLPVVRRGVQWEHAPAGTTDVQPCPTGHTGQAMWHCSNSTAQWTPESGPNLSGCVSMKLQNITDQLDAGASTTVISEELVNTVESVDELYGGDIVTVTSILSASLGNLDQELENATAEEKLEKTQEVTKNYLKVGSTILEDENLDSWDDLPDEKQTETASTLITSLEDSAFLLADNLEGGQTVVEEEDNVVMEVVVRNTEDLPDTDLVFPNTDQLSGDWRGVTDSITLPADAIRERTKDGKTKIVLLAYNNIGQFLGTDKGNRPSRPISTPKAEKQVDRRPCSADREEKRKNLGELVNSRVLSVSINDPWDSSPLSKPVNLTFEHQITGDNVTDPVCSFWKFDNRSGGFLSGEWADRGCVMVHNNATHTICSCDHLTNFAIIMNIKGLPMERGHAFALSFITYFGFIVSIPCLVLALITFCMFKNLQSDRTTIHKNLCLTLTLAEIIFIAGITQTSNRVVCGIIALLLHYLFLAAFAWMCLEGIQLYIMLVEVFEAESSRRKYYYPFGYFLPLVIVGISAAVDFDSYGTPTHCWLCTEGNFIWSFAAPVCLIMFGNILFLSMALFIMCRHSTLQTNPKEKTPKEKITEVTIDPYELSSANSDKLTVGNTKGELFKSLVRGALVLLCLLGITWAFGLLYISENLIVFAYIFTITNAFQGLFIYIFHCCMNDKVCKEYRRYVRNSTWLPDCIREQYGGTVLTNSNPQNSYRSSSAQKRPDSKRFSNTTGSYSVDQRKMSSSSVYRNSGQYEAVKFMSESVPEESVDLGTSKVVPDEGISMDFEDHPVLESTRLGEGDSNKSNDDTNSRLSLTEFQPLILDLEGISDNEQQPPKINVKPPAQQAMTPIEKHPLIRESGIGVSRSGSSCSEDFTPASPTSQDVPTKAHVFPNCSTCGITGSMPDLINPITAHACKARMDLVPSSNNHLQVRDNAISNNVHDGFHTLPNTSPMPRKNDSLPKSEYRRLHSDSESDPSPWHKRASRMDDVDATDSLQKDISPSTPTPSSPKSPKSKSPVETII